MNLSTRVRLPSRTVEQVNKLFEEEVLEKGCPGIGSDPLLRQLINTSKQLQADVEKFKK